MVSGKPFRGWYKKNGTSYTKVSDNIKYIFEADGNATYVADTDYSITYNLNGGTVATANPATYNRQTNTFTLSNPTKYLYDFMGWTGAGLSAKTKTVSIPKGSYGSRAYTANWETSFLHADDPYSKVENIKAFIDTYNNYYPITFRCDSTGRFYIDNSDGSVTLIYVAGSYNPKSNAQENAVCAAHVGDIINYILNQVYKDKLRGSSDQLLTSTGSTGTAYRINEPTYYNSWQGVSRAEGSTTGFCVLIKSDDGTRQLSSGGVSNITIFPD